MDPDIDDPNNHVPAVAPGDDWDDLDSPAVEENVGLPPRRTEQGLPPKKEARRALVNRHEPKAVTRAAVKADDAPKEVPEEEEEEVQKLGKRVSKK